MNIDDKNEIYAADKSHLLEVLLTFTSQIKEALKIANSSSLPKSYSDISKILVTGMGASGIPGDFLRVFCQDKTELPIVVNKSSPIPPFINDKTLFFAVSYSGNTRETLDAIRAAVKSDAKVVGVTSGSQLFNVCQEYDIPCVVVPKGGLSRCSFAYMFFPIVVILENLKIIPPIQHQINETIEVLDQIRAKCDPEVSTRDNLAKSLASGLYNKFPVIYGEHNFTDIVAFRWKQLFNENSKMLAVDDAFPELTHTEINAWDAKDGSVVNSAVIILRDKEHERENRLGSIIEVTKQILRENGTQVYDLWSAGSFSLSRLLSLSYIGDFVSIYLAILRKVDPAEIRNSEYIKKINRDDLT